MACMFLFFQLLAQMLSSFLELVIRNSHYAIPVWTAVFAVPLVAAPMTICVFLGLPAALPFARRDGRWCGPRPRQQPADVRLLPCHRQHGGLLDPQLPRTQGLRHGGREDRPAERHPGRGRGMFPAGTFHGPDCSGARCSPFWAASASGVVTGGIVPLAEIAFGYTTDITPARARQPGPADPAAAHDGGPGHLSPLGDRGLHGGGRRGRDRRQPAARPKSPAITTTSGKSANRSISSKTSATARTGTTSWHPRCRA